MNFVNHLNNTKPNNKKRKFPIVESIDSKEMEYIIEFESMHFINEISTKVKVQKGRELTLFLNNFIGALKDFISIYKNNDDVALKGVDTSIRLFYIALFSSTIKILEEIQQYILANRNTTLNDGIKYYEKSIKMNHFGNNKKAKPERIVYEDESGDETTDDEMEHSEPIKKPNKTKKVKTESVNIVLDYGDNDDDDDGEDDNDDDDDDEEEEQPMQLAKLKKNEKEFMEELFKSRSENPEDELLNYFGTLTSVEKKNTINQIKEINNFRSNNKPVPFEIMSMSLPINQKNQIMKQYTHLTTSRFPENKLKTWFEALMTIPFDKYKGINLNSMKPKKVKTFLDDLEKIMDGAVYGHTEAKRQIIQMMGHMIRNPKAKGNMLGLYGPPGNGKTSLIKEGIAKAMDKPFIFISLGGATDSSFLEGHSYTYEGSIYGRIVNGLISSKCMDPIIYFDELDKISKTPKGDEITNILIHLTDPAQNSNFRDKYFHGVDIDLSRATMIFSFNDPSSVNPILLDRITTVETKYLLVPQKIHIAKNYLLPAIVKDLSLQENDITIDDTAVDYIVNNYTREGGVRKLKSLLYNLTRELNLASLLKTSLDSSAMVVTFPFNITTDVVKNIFKNKHVIEYEKIHAEDKTGIINGMWASDNGTGGILPIEVLWIPSSNAMEVKATGNLQQVIKESTMVAATLAFNSLDKDLQDKYLTEWKERPKGFHLHCPDGSTPKDGPSAGTAITICLLSMLSNRKIKRDVAITGEINLQGKVTAIGGLENKLEGAKKAGITLALYPKENEKDIKKIKERNPNLIDSNFQVLSIETLDEAIKYSMV